MTEFRAWRTAARAGKIKQNKKGERRRQNAVRPPPGLVGSSMLAGAGKVSVARRRCSLASQVARNHRTAASRDVVSQAATIPNCRLFLQRVRLSKFSDSADKNKSRHTQRMRITRAVPCREATHLPFNKRHRSMSRDTHGHEQLRVHHCHRTRARNNYCELRKSPKVHTGRRDPPQAGRQGRPSDGTADDRSSISRRRCVNFKPPPAPEEIKRAFHPLK